MKIREEWNQPISRSAFWNSVMIVVLLLTGILFFTPIVHSLYLENLAFAVSVLVIWMGVIFTSLRSGQRQWDFSRIVFLVGYTFIAGGNLLVHKVVASWLSDIGSLLLIWGLCITIFDFTKSGKSA